jgi:amidophosphoribosyltransferase
MRWVRGYGSGLARRCESHPFGLLFLALMSDSIRHECGLALVRLRQPLTYYRDRYGDPGWGLRQLYLLMEKQHNRGQDGAGLAVVKFDMPPGEEYLKRIRSDRHNAIERIFDVVMRGLINRNEQHWAAMDNQSIKRSSEFLGEVYLGHLRYATHSDHAITNCHPYLRTSNTSSRNLAIAGNFNMTNSTELFQQLIEYGLNPVGESDTQVILERIGYFLDKEHEFLHATMGPESFRGLDGRELATEISREIDLVRIMQKASKDWDGGYVFAGLIGNGDLFVTRDPCGIRPGFFHIDDEVVAVASERAALANVFNVEPARIEEIKPGHVLTVKRCGAIRHERFTDERKVRSCMFERIYFSRGNDPEIYTQRKNLGRQLAPRVLSALGERVDNAVFSFIPNTAESAYMGLIDEIDRIMRQRHEEEIWQQIQSGTLTREELAPLINSQIRAEKVAHKDQRLRTFITHDSARREPPPG